VSPHFLGFFDFCFFFIKNIIFVKNLTVMERIDNSPATPESVWALLRENARQIEKSRAEFDERIEKSRVEFDERLEMERVEFDMRLKASEESFNRRMKKMDDRYGSMTNNFGSFAEEYFFNSFENGKQDFFGEKFDSIERNVKRLKPVIQDEYDIVMLNCTSVAIVETKFRAQVSNLPKIIKKAETFKINFPEFANHRIYLGLASMSFYEKLEEECKNAGIAIVKQVGETVVINDEHLKVF